MIYAGGGRQFLPVPAGRSSARCIRWRLLLRELLLDVGAGGDSGAAALPVGGGAGLGEVRRSRLTLS